MIPLAAAELFKTGALLIIELLREERQDQNRTAGRRSIPRYCRKKNKTNTGARKKKVRKMLSWFLVDPRGFRTKKTGLRKTQLVSMLTFTALIRNKKINDNVHVNNDNVLVLHGNVHVFNDNIHINDNTNVINDNVNVINDNILVINGNIHY